jgi:hypothetical protein
MLSKVESKEVFPVLPIPRVSEAPQRTTSSSGKRHHSHEMIWREKIGYWIRARYRNVVRATGVVQLGYEGMDSTGCKILIWTTPGRRGMDKQGEDQRGSKQLWRP